MSETAPAPAPRGARALDHGSPPGGKLVAWADSKGDINVLDGYCKANESWQQEVAENLRRKAAEEAAKAEPSDDVAPDSAMTGT